MVDFNKKIVNSDKFRGPALQFIKTGQYCQYPESTSEFYKFWDEERNRCINGYTADDGDFISGYNYFYLNYCPIQRITNKTFTRADGTTYNKRINEVNFPDFWDYDYYYFSAVQEAEEQGKHLCVLKSRRRGYSFKGGSMACRNYYLIPNSKTFVYAANKQYLTEDGILTKAWDYMDFIDKNTAWGKKRSVNTQMRKRAGFYIKDEYGNQIEMGYKSEITGVTLKDNPSSIRGKRANLIMFEEGGCHIAGTKVMMYDGSTKNVEDVKLGELLMGPDGTPRKVLQLHTGRDHMYEITPVNGDKQIVNSKHLIYGMHRQWYNNTYQPFTMRADQYYEMLQNKPYLKAHYSLIKTQFSWEEKEHVIDPYLLGLWLGDGTSSESSIASNDIEVIEYLQTYAITHGLFARLRKVNTTENCYLVHLSSGKPGKANWLLNELRNLKVLNNKHIPDDYIFDSRENRLKLLAGLIDTDGWYQSDKQYLCLSQSSERKHIIYAAQYIARSLGIKCTVTTKKIKDHTLRGKIIKGGNIEYRLTLLNNHQDIPTKIERKKVKNYHRDQLDPLSTRFKIDYYGVDNYYGFTVDKDNLFVLGDFTVTHNSMSELGAAWQIARPSVEVDGVAFAPMIIWGTGGDEDSKFATLKDMFYNPKGYNCLEFDNIWDEAATSTKCGFFVPQYTNMDIRDEHGTRLYMDNDGNTLYKPAIEYILAERQKVIENATSNAAIDRYVAERPITPAEAMLEFNGNIFPKKELQEQLSLLRTNKKLQNHKQVGDLVQQPDGTIKWVIKKNGDITHYPLKQGEDPTGSIVIWEHPNKDASPGLYIAGIDSYDYDESSTTSLGSCFIYKRVQSIEQYSDIIVAEYTGRPKSAEEFYENVRKLLLYYNARAMYENQNKGIFVYFTNKHCDYLLADQPDIINDIVGNSKVNRKKGCHMNKQIKQWGEGLIKDWLNDENSAGKKNLYNIMSEPLLEELIAYNDVGNFDRCLTKGTLITTDKGDVPIEEICIGDLVLTDKGNYKPVTWTDKHVHDGNIVTLQYSGDYQKLICTDNHPILVKYTDKLSHKFRNLNSLRENFLRADQLNYKYQFALVPKRSIESKPRTINDRMLYLLGWIMGDGYCKPKSNEVKITYQLDQLKCAEQCKQIIEEFDDSVPCKIVKDKSKNCYRLFVYSKKLHKLATNFGCIPNNKKINYTVYNNHADLIPFVLGLLEADGHQKYNVNYDGSNRNAIEISTIYEELLRQVRQILIDNGIYSTIREIKPRNGKKQVNLQINGEYVHKLLDYYSYDEPNSSYPIFSYKFKQIEYKYTKSVCLQDSRGFWVPIKLLESKETTDTVYNIEVQDDHTYVANGIVTHNCMALIQVMIYREQLYNVKVKEIKKENRNRVLFEGPIFTQQWFHDDEPTDNIEAYMF